MDEGASLNQDVAEDQSPLLSVVSPVYGCPSAIAELCRRLHTVLGSLTDDYEIVLVDDCSPDDSWEHLVKECRLDSRVKGLLFSRNFGQHQAITAGLDRAHGEWVVVMDCDLQDRPEEMPLLYAEALKGHDIILARRLGRRDRLTKRLLSRAFYSVFAKLSGHSVDPKVGISRIMHSRVVAAFREMKECHRLFGGMVQWLGFGVGSVDASHAERFDLGTSYLLCLQM